MIDKQKVSEVLDQVRVGLQSHGGDCRLVEVTDEGVVKVVLQGACRGCPMAQVTIRDGVQAALQNAIPEVTEVVSVDPSELEDEEDAE